MYKCYRYRIYPTKSQAVELDKQFGMCRFVYNYCLDLQTKEYQTNQKKLSKYDLQKKITILKRNNEWLKEGMSQALCRETENLEKAYTNFFKKIAKFPKFKSRKNDRQSFTIPQHFRLEENNKLHVPKLGKIKIIVHRKVPSDKLTSLTISKVATGKYYASINFQIDEFYPDLKPIDENQAIGIDLGIKTFATLSNSIEIENPKFLRKSLRKLKRLQRRHSKKHKDSNNREKSRVKLTNLYEKITNKRIDFLHQVTCKLTNEYNTICLETLKIKNMVKNHKLAQALSDVAIGTFNRQIEYKAKLKGVNIIRIGQFEPSSKMCSCGTINKELKLKDRIWVCTECGSVNDRDLLAAQNIKRFAFAKINTVGTTEI
jgi:putative transposase